MMATTREETKTVKRMMWKGRAGYSEGLTDLRRMVAMSTVVFRREVSDVGVVNNHGDRSRGVGVGIPHSAGIRSSGMYPGLFLEPARKNEYWSGMKMERQNTKHVRRGSDSG